MDDIRVPIPEQTLKLIDNDLSLVEIQIDLEKKIIPQLINLNWEDEILLLHPWWFVSTSSYVSGDGVKYTVFSRFFEELNEYLDYDNGIYYVKPCQSINKITYEREIITLGKIFGKIVYNEGFRCFLLLHPAIFYKKILMTREEDPRLLIPLYKYYFPDKYKSLVKVKDMSIEELNDIFQEDFSNKIIKELMRITPIHGKYMALLTQGINFYFPSYLDNNLEYLWEITFNIANIPDDKTESFNDLDDTMINFIKDLNDIEYVNLIHLCTGIPNGRLETKITVKWDDLTKDHYYEADTCKRILIINKQLNNISRMRNFFKPLLQERDQRLIDQ